jgi:hypothetical protein
MRNLLKSLVLGAVALALGLVLPQPSWATQSRAASGEVGALAVRGTINPGGLTDRLHVGGEARALPAAKGTIDPGG